MRDLDDEIEVEEFHSDGENEDNLPFVLLSNLELESSDNSDTEKIISAPRNSRIWHQKALPYLLRKRSRPWTEKMEKGFEQVKEVGTILAATIMYAVLPSNM